MEEKTNSIELFKKFAQHRLNNHLAELKTRYENEKIDKETLEQTYREHKKIFEKELDEKIQSSIKNNNHEKDELQTLKETFLSELKFNNQ